MKIRPIRSFKLPAGKTLAAAVLMAGLSLGHAPGQAVAEDLTEAEKSRIEQVIRDYLMEHPEVIFEAAAKYRAQQEAEQQAGQAQAMKGAVQFFADSKELPRAGNPDGDVQFVEFFDYQCGYCKRVFPQVMDIMEEDGKLDVVMVEFPVLGPVSEYAAKAALAAKKQDLYFEYHVALMGHRGRLSEKVILEVAEETGLDLDRLKADMESEEVLGHIARNVELASALGIRGTPAFIIGSQLAPGAIDKDQMEKMVSDARKGG